MKFIWLAILTLVLVVPTQAFAITTVFDVDVHDWIPDSDYKICMEPKGEPIKNPCLNFKGSELGTNYAEFQYEDTEIGDEFYVSVEEKKTDLFAYVFFENTKENPQIINISMLNGGSEQKIEKQNIETETDETPDLDEDTSGDGKKDYPDCKYDENGPTNEPCMTEDGELAFDLEDLDDDTGGSNPHGEEDDQSCGGQACSDDEKEDSTTDEEPFG